MVAAGVVAAGVVAAVPRRKREECVFPGDLARRYDAEGPVGHMDRQGIGLISTPCPLPGVPGPTGPFVGENTDPNCGA